MAAPSASDPVAEATTFLRPGQHRMVCPLCSHDRRKATDKCLSVVVEPDGSGAYTCWHCGAEGGWDAPPKSPLDDPSSDWFLPPLPDIPKGSPMSREAEAAGEKFMRERGIAEAVFEKHVLFDIRRFHGEPMPAVGFPYRSQDPLAIKWRCVPRKTFVQENTCSDFFNIDAYKEGDSILICEGELDALAWMTAGIHDDTSVCPVSVPNGAPSQVREGVIDPREDKKFACVWSAREELEECDRIYLNCDPDGPGKALEAELIRRLDASKIWLVRMPEGYKDANDLLRGMGPEALRKALRKARPLPMEGVYTAMDYEDALDELYEKGRPKGAYVGLHAVDRLFQVCPGMLTTVTGFPSSGKSDFIDQLCLLLALNHGWKTMMVSFEKDPASHVIQLTEKYVGLPYWEAKQGDHGHVRMTKEQADDARHFIEEHFAFVDEATSPTDLDGILRLASMAVMRLGVRILVIDPYNFIDIPQNQDSETNWVSKMLTQVKRWAARHQAHVFFVAHPAKPRDHVKTTSYVCTGLDISGSANWFNKTDIGLTVRRDENDQNYLHTWKIRWSWIGQNNAVSAIDFDPSCSRWRDPGADWRMRAEDEPIYSTAHWSPLPPALKALTSGQPSSQTLSEDEPSSSPTPPSGSPSADSATRHGSDAPPAQSSEGAPHASPEHDDGPASGSPPASHRSSSDEAARPSPEASPEEDAPAGTEPVHPVAPAGTSEGHPGGSSGGG